MRVVKASSARAGAPRANAALATMLAAIRERAMRCSTELLRQDDSKTIYGRSIAGPARPRSIINRSAVWQGEPAPTSPETALGEPCALGEREAAQEFRC